MFQNEIWTTWWEMASEMMAQFDDNDDDGIDIEEFVKMMDSFNHVLKDNPVIELRNALRWVINHYVINLLWRHIRCLDKTKTGLISSNDIKRTLGMKGSGEPGTVQIKSPIISIAISRLLEFSAHLLVKNLNVKSWRWWNQWVFGRFIDGNRWRNLAWWSYRLGFTLKSNFVIVRTCPRASDGHNQD